MKLFVGVLLLLAMTTAQAMESAAMVQVYSRLPGDFGKENVLICHVSGFHPPEIQIELRKNGIRMEGSKQTDLAFEENWHYHLTKSVAFKPEKNEVYTCEVTHMGIHKTYRWEPDM